jgi:hypothetical protein
VNKLLLKYITNIKEDEIVLPSEIKGTDNIIYKRIILNIGCWQRDFSVKYMEDWPTDTIGLARNFSSAFTLPDSISYKTHLHDRTLVLGPVIGLMFVTRHRTLTPEFLSSYKCYLNSYSEIGGLVFICSCECINIDNHTIKGYYYQPDSEDCWVEGVFPYPASLYRRVAIPNNKYRDLVLQMGDRIFNTYFFDKLELWDCLSPYEEVSSHLPYTEKLTEPAVLIKLLELYGTVYLKRVSGEKSKGIYRVEKTENGYKFIDRVRKQFFLSNTEEISAFLENISRKNGSYIVQQAIKVKRLENRSFDMRVVLQKDKDKIWSCTSMIARFGGTGSITSNIGLSGLAKRGREALKEMFGFDEEAAILKEKDIVSICCRACEILDKSIGHYGDLGIDVIVDENQKIWILEINKLHYHPYPVYALKDRELYHKTAAKPVVYAAALAGF